MKMNLTQIRVLSESITNTLNKENRKKYDEMYEIALINNKNKVKLIEKDIDTIKNILKKYKHNNNIFNNQLEFFHKEALKTIKEIKDLSNLNIFVRQKQIENDLIINSIECDNLEELIKSINKKYKI